jgi:hypothetical protein
VLLANVLAVIGYVLMGSTKLYPILPILLIGFHLALMPAALWPALQLVISEKHSGIAISISSSLLNAALSGANPLAGHIADKFGFFWVCMFFSSLACIAVLTTTVWNVLDARSEKPVLNKKSL